MKIAVFSDIHLKQYSLDKKKYDAFIQALLSLEGQNVQQLILLGDIVDILIGSFDFWHQEHAPLFETLEKLQSKGVQITWFEGNHDFHFSKLAEHYGIQSLDGEKILEFSDKLAFFAHGDLVDQSDKKYLRWRAFTRNKLFRFCVDKLPSFSTGFFYKLSQKISSTSRKNNRDFNFEKYRSLFLNFAKDLLQKDQNICAVFLGHSHVSEFQKISPHQYYVNLGFWSETQGSYCLWDLKESPEIINVNYSSKGQTL